MEEIGYVRAAWRLKLAKVSLEKSKAEKKPISYKEYKIEITL